MVFPQMEMFFLLPALRCDEVVGPLFVTRPDMLWMSCSFAHSMFRWGCLDMSTWVRLYLLYYSFIEFQLCTNSNIIKFILFDISHSKVDWCGDFWLTISVTNMQQLLYLDRISSVHRNCNQNGYKFSTFRTNDQNGTTKSWFSLKREATTDWIYGFRSL